MEVISSLHKELQQASDRLENIQNAVNQQELQIKDMESKNSEKLKEKEDTTKALSHFRSVLLEEKNRLKTLSLKNQELEAVLETVEGKLSVMPVLFQSLCSQLIESSTHAMTDIDARCQIALKESYWSLDIDSLETNIEANRTSLKTKMNENHDKLKLIEDQLDQEFEEEQNSYNIVLACIEAYENKNMDIRKRSEFLAKPSLTQEMKVEDLCQYSFNSRKSSHDMFTEHSQSTIYNKNPVETSDSIASEIKSKRSDKKCHESNIKSNDEKLNYVEDDIITSHEELKSIIFNQQSKDNYKDNKNEFQLIQPLPNKSTSSEGITPYISHLILSKSVTEVFDYGNNDTDEATYSNIADINNRYTDQNWDYHTTKALPWFQELKKRKINKSFIQSSQEVLSDKQL